MAKAFSVASWNVERFYGDPKRVDRVVDFLARQSANIIALYEVSGNAVFGSITSKMPNYTFHITEGPQTQEILIGIKSGITAFFTQKLEFKAGSSYLRPGALVSITVDNKVYSLLFLHTKSGSDPKGLGLRDDMFYRAFKFRSVLDKKAGGAHKSNYIFLGDLNTMGMEYPYDHDIPAPDEIKRLNSRGSYRKMRVLDKDEPVTWSNGSGSTIPDSDLDQVVAAKHLVFKKFNGKDVAVRGWPKESTQAKKDTWINKYSDHGLLYFEVQKV